MVCRLRALVAALAAWLAAAGSLPSQELLLINEFLASNATSLRDADGESSDWIEILNPGSAPVALGGWALTDNALEPKKWLFPPLEIAAGGFLVVFASGKDRRVAGAELHTNFKLEASGEFLALVRPDGSAAHAYGPRYPRQRTDFSYGLAMEVTTLVAEGAPVEIHVPTSGSLGTSWTQRGFAPDGSWLAGRTGVGFDVGGTSSFPPPVAYWSLDGTTEDLTGPNPGSFEGGPEPTFTAGFDGTPDGALDLDGGNDYLDVLQGRSLPIYSHPAYTVALWVKGLPQNDRRVFSEGSRSENNSLFTIGTDNTGATGAVDIFIRTAAGSAVVNHVKSVGTAFDGTWHHIAWVDQNGAAALYIDGVRDGRSFNYTKPSLALNVTSLGAVLRSSACCFFRGALDDVAVWDSALSAQEIAELAAGASPMAGGAYRRFIASDIGQRMLGVSSSVYLRIPFSVSDPSAIDSLTLRMRYDDGFVAYLNGVEVARRNAPAALAWNSSATAERGAREAVVPESINVSAHAGVLVAGANVLAIHGLNRSAADPDFLIVPELVAASSDLAPRFFAEPTPGAPNTGGFIDFVADTKFSADRGFYDEPFQVVISTATPGATIRYTTDLSWPSQTHGEVYSGPIPINRFTILRAMAYREGYLSTNVDTHTYNFLDDVLRQPRLPPGFPATWQPGWTGDYEMDPEICLDPSSPHYYPTVKEDLKAIPTLSLSLEQDDLFGPTRGIYNHSENRGLAWERRCSAELIHPDGRKGFQVNCGVRMQGGASRDNVRQIKHSFRLLFKRLYGPPKLEYPWFENSPVTRFDTVTLRCFFTDGWATRTVEPRYRPADSQYIRDVWMKDSQLDMGQPGGRNTYVHLYINGLYWGLYNPTERPDGSMNAEHYGGSKEDWDVYKDFGEVQDGNALAWQQMMAQANSGLASTAAFQRIQGNNPDGTPNDAIPNLLDVENLIDYMTLHIYAGAEDWPHHNWYAARRRVGPTSGFKFYVWDQEIVLDELTRDRTGVNNDNTPARLYSALRANLDFRVWFGDRVHKHMFHGGALTTEGSVARWMRRAREIDRAIVGESARWGDIRREPPFTRDVEWIAEQRVLVNQYFPQIHGITLERFRRNNLYPRVIAPEFSQHGGVIAPGFELAITAAAGTVYYTLDGSDPRLPGGAVSPRARLGGQSGFETLLDSGASARALVPADDSLGLAWTQPGFDDSRWIAGTSGVGFERQTGYEALIGLDVGPQMDGVNTTVYTRFRFEVAEPETVEVLTLRMKYDDGFLAYLNGVLVASSNAPAEPRWNSEATRPNPDTSAIVFEDFDITSARGLLRRGENLLAVHGLNSSLQSGDLLILPEVVSSRSSGGIRLSGPTTVKARVFDGAWSALNEAFFYRDIPLRITELMYDPPPPPSGSPYGRGDFEFIELENIGETPLDLAGIRLAGGVEFDFDSGALARLFPGELVLVVRNLQAFATRYNIAFLNIAGEYRGGLSKYGELLRLEGPAGEPILAFEYVPAWHPSTAGEGHSLVIADPRAPAASWGEAAGWRPSLAPLGSPGERESGEPPAGGLQLPGNVNQDQSVDLSDAISILRFLFIGAGAGLPCEGGVDAGGNLALLDLNGDRIVNLSDPVYLLVYLFRGGPPPVLGMGCVRIAGCPEACPR
jgi:hypothetical protein